VERAGSCPHLMTRSAKKKVAVLGGSFDPIHYGHLGLAAEVKEKVGMDRVLFVPACISPHKQDRALTDARHRTAMLRLALREQPAFSLSEIELQRKGVSYTVNTVEALLAAHGDWELYWVMGYDAFQELDSWKEPRRLMTLCHIIAGTRPGYPKPNRERDLKRLGLESSFLLDRQPHPEGLEEYGNPDTGRSVIFIALTPREVSSSEIRRRIRDHRSVKNWLPPEVEHYIISNQLYQTESHTHTE